jgi:hypothetical protein
MIQVNPATTGLNCLELPEAVHHALADLGDEASINFQGVDPALSLGLGRRPQGVAPGKPQPITSRSPAHLGSGEAPSPPAPHIAVVPPIFGI